MIDYNSLSRMGILLMNIIDRKLDFYQYLYQKRIEHNQQVKAYILAYKNGAENQEIEMLQKLSVHYSNSKSKSQYLSRMILFYQEERKQLLDYIWKQEPRLLNLPVSYLGNLLERMEGQYNFSQEELENLIQREKDYKSNSQKRYKNFKRIK